MSSPITVGRASRRWLRFLIPASALAAVLGAGALAWAETEAVPSYWEGLWSSLALVTTVGFVGPVPTSATGKIVSSVLMILGFALMAMTTAAVASFFVREDELPDERREQRFEHLVLTELAELRRELAELRRDEQSSFGSAPDSGRRGDSGGHDDSHASAD